MLEDLIEYIKRVRSELIKKEYPKPLIDEITKIAIDNWVYTSEPKINKEQIFKAISTSLSKIKINLN